LQSALRLVTSIPFAYPQFRSTILQKGPGPLSSSRSQYIPSMEGTSLVVGEVLELVMGESSGLTDGLVVGLVPLI